MVVLSGLRNSTLYPRFPLSLAQHATVTTRQLAAQAWREVRLAATECVCIVVVCVCVLFFFLCDYWVCSNVA